MKHSLSNLHDFSRAFAASLFVHRPELAPSGTEANGQLELRVLNPKKTLEMRIATEDHEVLVEITSVWHSHFESTDSAIKFVSEVLDESLKFIVFESEGRISGAKCVPSSEKPLGAPGEAIQLIRSWFGTHDQD